MNRRQKNLLFWILQTGGWVIYAGAYFIFLRKPSEASDFTDKFLYLFTYLVGFLITVLLRYLFRIFRRKIKRNSLLLLSALAILILACPLWYSIDIWISMKFWDPVYVEKFLQKVGILLVVRVSIGNFIPLLAWSTLYFGITYWLELQEEKKRAEEAIHLARKSQFEMLRYQLNPHFLFNSLNSTRALIDEDPKAAREIITELSEFLRYSLLDKEIAFRPLREELKALQHYLSIEKRRFEEKLVIDYQIGQGTEEKTILSFLIHPVIENAIKYGMKTSETPLRLLIRTAIEEDFLVIRICNSGHWIGEEESGAENGESTGTGLENVRKRLENAYPGHHYFSIEKGDTLVCITIGIHESGETQGT